MANWKRAGERPVAWWLCELGEKERNRIQRQYPSLPDAIYADFADADEKRAIR